MNYTITTFDSIPTRTAFRFEKQWFILAITGHIFKLIRAGECELMQFVELKITGKDLVGVGVKK